EPDAKLDPFYFDDDFVSFACDYPITPAKINGVWHLIQLSGKATSLEKFEPIVNQFIERMNEPLLSKQNGKFGYTDMFGNEVIPFVYTDADWFTGLFAKVTINNMKGLINTDNTLAIPIIYDEITEIAEGASYKVKRGGKEFEVDTYGNLATPTAVTANDYGKVGYIWQGRPFIDCKFDFVTEFLRGFALVNLGGIQQPDGNIQGGKWGVISYAGDYIIEPTYDELAFFTNGIIRAKNNQGWGLINLQNEIVLPFEYTEISAVGDSFGTAKKNEVEFTINKFGKIVER
ncbi:MAG TPA: hypothetical protein DCQ31_17245, partial [Bacteroidales bacterium]|nr:hypothetical protein [Bacteroidales bacterium]